MAEDLATAQNRIEQERRRLAVTIESLGDALIVTEPGSSEIAAVNPRATELVPELTSVAWSTARTARSHERRRHSPRRPASSTGGDRWP